MSKFWSWLVVAVLVLAFVVAPIGGLAGFVWSEIVSARRLAEIAVDNGHLHREHQTEVNSVLRGQQDEILKSLTENVQQLTKLHNQQAERIEQLEAMLEPEAEIKTKLPEMGPRRVYFPLGDYPLDELTGEDFQKLLD